MKGIEESLSQAVFFIGAVLAAFILIYMASQYLSGFNKNDAQILAGNKNLVLGEIKNMAISCWDKNQERKNSEICSKTYLNESLNISSVEITNYLKGSKIPLSAENLTGPCEIRVAYQNSRVVVENR
jgi:hypothetical protein